MRGEWRKISIYSISDIQGVTKEARENLAFYVRCKFASCFTSENVEDLVQDAWIRLLNSSAIVHPKKKSDDVIFLCKLRIIVKI